MASFPEPIFFETDEDVIIAEATAFYEGLVGRQLAPTQTEVLLINAFAYREKLIRVAGNEASKQNLLEFARYPMLDYLGAFLSVERLPASNALTTLVFTMVSGHPSLVIPAGVRVQSTDGKAVFMTLADLTVSSLDSTKSILAQCTTEGTLGNNYAIGNIAIMLDPQAFVQSVANSTISNGGADIETDDSLRERIRLAPSAFSSAGPDDAYIYFAKSASPSIIDVAITSPNPGDVHIFPLLAGGVAPSQEIIDAVLAKCNPEKVRPLNDVVAVLAPAAVNYALTVELTLLTDAIDASVLELVNSNLNTYIQARQTKLGVDVVISQIIGRCMVEGVYECNVISPATDIIINLDQFANCTGLSVTITGETDA
jgi:phage-related baseplate assembly protein